MPIHDLLMCQDSGERSRALGLSCLMDEALLSISPASRGVSVKMPLLLNRMLYEPWHEISNNVVCATRIASDQPPAHMRSLI